MALSPSRLWSMRKWLQPFGCWYIPYTLPRSWWQTVSDFQLRSVSKTRWEALRYGKSYLLSDKYKFFAHTFTKYFQVVWFFWVLFFFFPCNSPLTNASWHYRQKVNPLSTLKTTFQEAHTTPWCFLPLLNCISVLFRLDCLFFSIANTH